MATTASAEPAEPAEDQLLEAGAERATVLTDGVIAIAITLLALDLKPDLPSSASSHQLAHFLSTHSGQYLAFALAFFLIAQYWLTNHRMMRTVRRATGRLLAYTLVFLFGVTIAPLTTYLNGDYDNALARTIFAANIAFISLALALMGQEIHSKGLDDRVETDDERLRRHAHTVLTVGIPALAGAMSWVVGGNASYLYLLFFVADVPAKHLVRRRERRRSA